MRPRLVEVGRRLLHRDDVVDPGEAREQRRLHVEHDALRDVVEDHGPIARGLRDGREVPVDALGRRLVVVRRHRQDGVGAAAHGLAREVHGVRRVVGPGARDHGHLAAHLAGDGLHEVELLGVAEGGRLARGAVDDQALGAVAHEVARDGPRLVEVERAVGGERGHHRGEDAAERRGHGRAPSCRTKACAGQCTAPLRGTTPRREFCLNATREGSASRRLPGPRAGAHGLRRARARRRTRPCARTAPSPAPPASRSRSTARTAPSACGFEKATKRFGLAPGVHRVVGAQQRAAGASPACR